MPQVRITANPVASRTVVRVGDVVNLSDEDARLLIRIGKAERIATGANPAPAAALLRSPKQRGQTASKGPYP